MSLYNYSNNYSSCGSGCSCDNQFPICTPENVDNSCSLKSIRQTILAIIDAIKNTNVLGLNVDVEITTKNGYINTVNFSKLNIESIILTESTLIVNNLAISLCDIVKINVLSNNILSTNFPSTLLNAIKNITTNCFYLNSDKPNNKCSSNCNSAKDVKCAQGMQNYINENIASIQNIGYNGGVSAFKDISQISDITTIDVVDNATINTNLTAVLDTVNINTNISSVLTDINSSTQTVDVLNSATLNSKNTSVIGSITASAEEVVSDVNLQNVSLLSDITPNQVNVSAPINVDEVSVVSSVSITEDTPVVSSVQTTQDQVITEVSTSTGSVVTSVPEGEDIEGVISGVTVVKSITPDKINVPTLTSTGTGVLQVTIAARSIDGTNPVSPIVLNVKVGNQDITFGGNTSKDVLPDDTKLIGYTSGTPTSTTVKQTGVPTTDTFIKTVETENAQFVKSVTPSNITGKFVTQVQNTDINNVQTPTTESVIQTIDKTPQTVNVVTTVDKVEANTLFSTTNQEVVSDVDLSTTTESVINNLNLSTTTGNVVSSANLVTTTENVVNNVNISLNKTPVINDLEETTTTVYAPIQENIDGRVFAAGDGIMAVNNTNGDISVYSICDINTITS